MISFWALQVSLIEHKGASELLRRCRCFCSDLPDLPLAREDSSSLLCHLLWCHVTTLQGHGTDAPESSWIQFIAFSRKERCLFACHTLRAGWWSNIFEFCMFAVTYETMLETFYLSKVLLSLWKWKSFPSFRVCDLCGGGKMKASTRRGGA